MQKRWTAFALAALMLFLTACNQRAQLPEESNSSQSAWTPPAEVSQPEEEETEPVEPPPSWEEGRTVEHMPDQYGGLELPVQGATGYISVEMPLWRAVEDAEAAALAVEEWEKAEEERLAQEQAQAEAQAQTGAQAGTVDQPADSSSAGTQPSPPAESSPDPAASTPPSPTASADAPLPEMPDASSAGAGTAEPESAEGPEGIPAEPGESPAAGQEPVPEGGETAAPPESASAAGTPTPEAPETQPPQTTSEVPAGEGEIAEEQIPTLTDGALALVAPGTPFTILREEGDWWQVAVETDYFTDEEQTTTQHGEITGWLEHRYCLINLPDVIPSIIYDATNSYSSHFVSCGKRIPEVTGEALYPSKTYNARLDKMEFMMPVLYSMAFKLCEAQQLALSEGNSLILYEGYRPHTVQTKVLNALSALARTDEEIKEAVTGAPWEISWFISGGYSNHQRGYAVDVGLAKVTATKEYTTGGLRYVRVWDFER